MLTRYPSYLVSENIRQQRFEAAFLELDRICQLAESQGVTLWIYISPVHARLLPLLESVGLDVWWTEWRRRVATLVEDYDEDQCVAWDFSGYNSITTEAVPRDEQARMRYYWEASHFRPAVGDAMIQRMSGQTDILYQDFGHRLRSAEMDAYLAREQRQAALWRESLDARETALIIRFLQEHYAQPAMLEAALTHPSEVLVPWLDDRLAAEQSEASP